MSRRSYLICVPRLTASKAFHCATATGLLCGLLASAPPASADDAVTQWNQIAASATLSAGLAPVQQTRAMAIVQVAVHDAVNAVTRQYATYLSLGPAPAGASPEAAAIAAAHHALRNLFPGQALALDGFYADSLAAHGLSETDPGIQFGKSVAAAILALRANDGSTDAQFDYTVPGAGTPGIWERLGGAAALLPGWGNITPWVLRSGAQFRPDPPPALDSTEYVKDYYEVKDIGSSNSATRTAEQTGIAMFWRGSPTAIWNQVLNQVIAARSLDLSTTARVFALFYLAAADGSVAVWEAKYTYNFWRPFPAIRDGDLDGNPLTIGDPDWRPLLATPPHPEYPSAHTANSGAMAAILAHVFGDDPAVPLVVTSFGVTRQWDTFSEPLEEVIDARVYSGFHFRTADVVGARLGRQVARFILTHALRPLTPPRKP